MKKGACGGRRKVETVVGKKL